jgi:hypothetical protein
MHAFLKKLALFLLLPLVYFMLMAGVNTYLRNQSGPDIGKSSVLIAGDSFMQKAIDPKQLHQAQNISQTAEPYLITYWKLQKLLPIVMPDTLILGFSHHNLAEFNDRKFADPHIAQELFERVGSIQHFSAVQQLDIDQFLRLQIWWKQYCFYPNTQHHLYVGAYENQPTVHLADSLEAVQRHFYNNNQEDGLSELSVAYLDSIVQLCRMEDVYLILVASPVSDGYWRNMPKLYKDQFNLQEKRLQQLGVPVWNFSTADYPASYFLNADHLNSMGSKRFSHEVDLLLSE